MTGSKPYLTIVAHYENCLKRFGDSHLGVDWRDAREADKRYQVMMDIIENVDDEPVTLLDFGCGTAGLYDFINNKQMGFVEYVGRDISSTFIEVCKRKYPNLRFINMDILDHHADLPQFDYIVLNGVFTERIDLSHTQIFDYFCVMIQKLSCYCVKGIAFNLRSIHVEKEDDDLFHLSLNTVANFLTSRISSNFVIRNDYGLDEYAVYLYPQRC